MEFRQRYSPRQESLDRAREYAEMVRGRLGDRVKNVILFGSQARGDATNSSDFDVLVVVDQRNSVVREATLEAGVEMMDRHSTLFAALVCEEDEWEQGRDMPIGWNISREGIAL